MKNFTHSRPKPRSAFTLIELLVVVTIIVVLLALLVPAMDKAMDHATRVVCASTLHSWPFAMRQYAFDHKGRSVWLTADRREMWYDKLAPYMGQPNWDPRPPSIVDDTTGPYAGMMKPNYCPETDSRVIADWVGSAHIRWNYLTAQGSYGWNLWLTDNYYRTDERFAHKNFYTRYNNAPGEIPLIGDCNWIGSWPMADWQGQDIEEIVPPDLEAGFIDHQNGRFMGRFSIARHGIAINLAFVDGSAQTIPLWDLWKLRWHANANDTARDPSEFQQ